MKQASKLITIAAFSSILFGQEAETICGLPAIPPITPGVSILTKRLPPSTILAANQRTFFVREELFAIDVTFIELVFTLMHTDTDFEVWAELAEVDTGHVDSAGVDLLVRAFRDSTFAESIDVGRGIKSIADQIFGLPPDVDNNGKVFILLYDIRDGYDPDTSQAFVSGYFDPVDQQSGPGNLADIIYMDTFPGRMTGRFAFSMLSTLAHEYQHLIHYARDRDEDSWVNEGLSELSPVLMGLPHREFTRYLVDTNNDLASWNNTLEDYARTSLFFLYTWVQAGTQFLQDLIGFTENGISGMQRALTLHDLPLMDEFVYDWHLANMFNHDDGPRGYKGLYALPSPTMHDIVISYPATNIGGRVDRFGARWTLVTGGKTLYMSADRNTQYGLPKIDLIRKDTEEFLDLQQLFGAGFIDSSFGIDYPDLFILATNTSILPGGASYSFYIAANGSFQEITLSAPGLGEPDIIISLSDSVGFRGEASVEFDIPDTDVNIFKLSFLSYGFDTTIVRLYANSLLPANVIYVDTLDALSSAVWTNHVVPGNITASNQIIFASIETGNALGYGSNTGPARSWFRFPGETEHIPLNSLYVTNAQGERVPLDGNWYIKLSYLRPDTSTGPVDIPLYAGQFYPNPFIPAEIGYITMDISPGDEVFVELFNLQGQEIWRTRRAAGTLLPIEWNGVMSNGKHAPSGIYIFRVWIGSEQFIRKIVLLK